MLEQMRVAMALANERLQHIDDEDLHWRPAPSSWGVEVRDGLVVADWVQPEPADVAPPTLAWQFWHLQWWMEMALDSYFGDGALARESFELTPAELSLGAINRRYERLRDAIESVPAERWSQEIGSGFPYRDGRPFGLLAGWVALELVKCVADMVKTRAFAPRRPR